DFVSDKWRLLLHARASGVTVPRTVFIERGTGVKDIARDLTYPIVIKPHRSRILTREGWIGTSVHHAATESQLRRLYNEVPYLREHPSLLQEHISGPGLGVF